ncbi:FAD-dependent monooxygenase [Chitinophaga solisilvae]|uniref:FAD-dependent monooxygenase n=1 Tax=Chitinophaga solisilvae TaxID=1233460 RepID=UPI0013719B36|nr:FAD-dependent monooxygenase [Chitinophaga solisilvae]
MKAVIIGAGIGGLTTALALAHYGIDYEIFDAAPANLPVGAGMLMGANAMNVLEKLDMAAPLRQRAVFPESIYIKDYQGEILQHISNTEVRDRYGNGSYAVHRAAVQDELIKGLKKPVQWGKKLAAIEEHENGVTARFEDGSSAAGDLLIGVDGIRSLVREKYIAPAQYRYSGQICWRAIVPMTLPPEEINTTAEVWGPGNGLRASFVQVDPQQVYFWYTKKLPAGTPFEPQEALDMIRRDLLPFKGYMQTVVCHIPVEKLIRSDLYDIAPVHTWYRGRIVLLGDAAHATTPNLGQGASQAVEDAWVLAGCLATESSITTAFQAYQDKRIARAHKIVNTSWSLAMLTNRKGRFITWLRNRLLKSVPRRIADKQIAFLFGIRW